MQSAQYWIEHLQMQRHPEGGYFRELYRATESIPHSALPSRFSGSRSFSTSIVYLLEKDDFSAWHRILSDETWHFYAGDPLELFQLDSAGSADAGPHSAQLQRIVLGQALHAGQHLQWTVPAGVWFASRVVTGGSFSLLGCGVSPGFDFADFELADYDSLSRLFPQYGGLIGELTLSRGK